MSEPINTNKNNSILVLIILCYGQFAAGSIYAILGPTFPKEAKKQGLSEAQIGLIISEFQIASLITSFFLSIFAKNLNPRITFLFALFAEGVCNVLFGLIHYSSNEKMFLLSAMILRTIEGSANALLNVSIWTITTIHFKDRVSDVLVTTEAALGFGLIVGPGLGGALNHLGEYLFESGFGLPYYLFGATFLLGSILSLFLIKDLDINREIESETTSAFDLIKRPTIFVNLLIATNANFLFGFTDATLDLHIKTYIQLNPSFTGLIFVIPGLFYLINNFVWISFKQKPCSGPVLSFLGCILTAICFSLIGPLPINGIDFHLYLVLIGQTIFSIGASGLFIGSFADGFSEIIRLGFPDNMATSSAMAGCYSTALAIGAAIGPAFGGYLMGEWGYRFAIIPVIGLQLFLAIVVSLVSIHHYFTNKPEKEYQEFD